ncbi:unnamed protein product [Peronospora destructor]|uniref:Reverse transcriptase Ty1/copia-type domain-containing protein n=1 Tax=Peronospora destructor TaxID=86335 RepID=A0AAV0TWE4_9STRA|nr:unnamed protein product [Peronospora destructor]
MTEEFNALKSNDVWTIVIPPKGAHQVFSVDNTLKFAAVMDLGTVKIILVLSRRWNVPARHGDVPNAYVKAEKEEHLDIYMKIPKGMVLNDQELKIPGAKTANDLALLLKKSLYGLKQAGRLWSKLFDSKLRQGGFQQCTTDMCRYKYKGKTCTVVGVYVDDLLVAGTEQSDVDEFFEEMSLLSIKDLGVVNKFLGYVSSRTMRMDMFWIKKS